MGTDDDIMVIPAARSGICPACSAQVVWGHLERERFFCPQCHVGLRLRPAYFKTLFYISLVIAFLVLGALGFRGFERLSVIVVIAWPVFRLVRFVNIRLFRVDLETTSDVRALLYGINDVQPALRDRETAESVTVDSVSDVDEGSVQDENGTGFQTPTSKAPAFKFVEPDLGIAGTLLSAAALVYLVYFLFLPAGTAVLYRFLPDLVETRHAPKGFEMRAELRRDAIAFTNESTETWRCVASIGYTSDSVYRAAFSLEPGQTRVVQYVDFRPPRSTVQPDVLRAVARDQLTAMCGDSNGRSHWGLLE